MSETTSEQIARLTRERDAALRELERWRHGEQVEGDYVCPDSLRADQAERERDEARNEREHLAEIVSKLREKITQKYDEECRQEKEYPGESECWHRVAALGEVLFAMDALLLGANARSSQTKKGSPRL